MAKKKAAAYSAPSLGRTTGAAKVPAYGRRAAMRFTTSNS